MTAALDFFNAPPPAPPINPQPNAVERAPVAQKAQAPVSVATGAAESETPVGIYETTSGITAWRWLCAGHVKARKAAGWSCKRTGERRVRVRRLRSRKENRMSMRAAKGMSAPASVYHKPVPTKTIDVYRVLVAFGVSDPCIQHAIKKLLCAGQRRGGKTIDQDVAEAIWSLRRWEEMRAEEAAK